MSLEKEDLLINPIVDIENNGLLDKKNGSKGDLIGFTLGYNYNLTFCLTYFGYLKKTLDFSY